MVTAAREVGSGQLRAAHDRPTRPMRSACSTARVQPHDRAERAPDRGADGRQPPARRAARVHRGGAAVDHRRDQLGRSSKARSCRRPARRSTRCSTARVRRRSACGSTRSAPPIANLPHSGAAADRAVQQSVVSCSALAGKLAARPKGTYHLRGHYPPGLLDQRQGGVVHEPPGASRTRSRTRRPRSSSPPNAPRRRYGKQIDHDEEAAQPGHGTNNRQVSTCANRSTSSPCLARPPKPVFRHRGRGRSRAPGAVLAGSGASGDRLRGQRGGRRCRISSATGTSSARRRPTCSRTLPRRSMPGGARPKPITAHGSPSKPRPTSDT